MNHEIDTDLVTGRVIFDRIWRPANRENNWAAFVMVGREGSGKSHTTASVLERVDPTFDADRVFFEPESLIGFISELSKEERQGKAVMLDEAGVGMGVRSWYDQDQVKVNKAAQTMRDDNMILAATLPSFSLLDSQLRTRMHGFCEMRALKPGDHAVWSWKDIHVNREESGDEIKRKPFPLYPSSAFPKRFGGGERTIKVTRLKIAPPSEEFVEAYEERKAEFKQALYDEIAGEEEGEEDEGMSPRDVATEIARDDISTYVSIHGQNRMPYINADLIRADYDLSQRDAKAVKSLLERQFGNEELEALA